MVNLDVVSRKNVLHSNPAIKINFLQYHFRYLNGSDIHVRSCYMLAHIKEGPSVFTTTL